MNGYADLNSGEEVARYRALTEAFELVVVAAATSNFDHPEVLLRAAMDILALRDELDEPVAMIEGEPDDDFVQRLRHCIRVRGGNVQVALGTAFVRDGEI